MDDREIREPAHGLSGWMGKKQCDTCVTCVHGVPSVAALKICDSKP